MIFSFAQALPAFLVPGLAVAGAVAVAAPILIHILSRRPRRPEPWAAMRFLLAAYQKHRMRTRLEQWLLLAMRCLLILLIGLALAGPVFSALGAWSGVGGGGRTIVLILDNSLTSNARRPNGEPRFDRLREAAYRLLEETEPGDRVALITAARPAEAVIAPPSTDPAAVRRRVERIDPVAAAADLPEALALARDTLESGPAEGRAYVALLSDLSAGAVGEAALPERLAELGERATLVHLAAEAGASNVQVAGLTPDRGVVVGDTAGASPSVAWTIALRRYAGSREDTGMSRIRLERAGAAPVRRNVSWGAGQREAELRITTPLEREGLIAAQAVLEPMPEGEDVLGVDNTRHALVRARRQLNVMIVGGGAEGASDPGGAGWTPRRWLNTALAPVSDRLGWPIEVRERGAAALASGSSGLSGSDAAFILRPDLLDEAGWEALARWTRAGGLAWFFPPAGSTPALWPQRLSEAYSLPWSVNPEPEAAPEGEAWRLASDEAGGEALDRLRADLPDLLGPIRVRRRLAIDPASLGSETRVILREAGGAGGDGAGALLIGAATPRGRGRVLLAAAAIDTDWTNLPTKPLFVPLIHETLRAAIDALQPRHAFEAGDRPLLGSAWAAAGELTTPAGDDLPLVRAEPGRLDRAKSPDAANAGEGDDGDIGGGGEDAFERAGSSESSVPPALSGSDASGDPSGVDDPGGFGGAGGADEAAGVRPVRPLLEPGVYRGGTEALVVRVRPEAADTRAVPEAERTAWLEGAGRWETAEAADPAAPLRAGGERAELGWPLLWVVLILALLEMLLARYASHAGAAGRSANAMEERR